MTDNFELFREYVRDAGIPESKHFLNDKFFIVELIRRGKDCPDLPAANYTFKTYYIDSIDEFDRAREEIVSIAKILRSRAYISVNCKSKIKSLKKTLLKIASAIDMDESKKPWRLFNSSCNEVLDKNDKRWVVDLDTKNEFTLRILKELILESESEYVPENRIILEVPTKNGIHLITRPFNVYKFAEKFAERSSQPVPDIKKNHLSLLYEDLEDTTL